NYVFSGVSDHLKFEMRNRGVILAPASGKSFKTEVPFTGTGGCVMQGAGTLAFGTGAWAFTGALDVQGGTVDLSSAGAVTDRKVTGSGTLSSGAFSGLTLALPASDDWTPSNTLTFASCTFAGRTKVDFGRTAEAPLDGILPKNLTVAYYTGAAPDVSGWKMTGSGIDNVAGVFTAADGAIRMTARRAGMVFSLR
ncbi:MAG TPA: hypothetical protein PKI32_00360, partial [Opitutales bacterium]|nr:hypothetical protein [Opitutales bacterium]